MPESKTFSLQDAQDLINLARRAPLANLDVATEAMGLLQRFATFATAALNPPTDESAIEKPVVEAPPA